MGRNSKFAYILIFVILISCSSLIATLESQSPAPSTDSLSYGPCSLQQYESGHFKGILSTHTDGTVRIWDCEHGTELYSFAAASPSSGPLRAVHILTPVVVDARTFIGPTQLIVTGDGNGSVQAWKIPKLVLQSGQPQERDIREVLPLAPDGQVLVAIQGPEKCQFKAVHHLSVGGESNTLLAAAVARTYWPHVEDREAIPGQQTELQL